jgi:outer membrane lipoprotein-sorting protein
METEAQRQARQVFLGIEKRFEELQSIQYAVERTTVARQGTVREQWTFTFRNPDCFRLHYQAPAERVIVANPDSLWEHVPAARKARHTNVARLSARDRSDLISQALARVAVDGIRVGNCEDLVRRTTAFTRDPSEPQIVHIEGRAPRFVMAVDTNRCVLLRSELYDQQGELGGRTRTESFTEVQPGFWYPKDIETLYRTAEGHVTSRTRFSDIRINAAISNDVFRFAPPRHTTVVDADSRQPR